MHFLGGPPLEYGISGITSKPEFSVVITISLKIPLTRSAIEDRFKQVIGFTDSVHILHDETSAFEHAAELQIGLGTRHCMDYPLDPGELPQRGVSLRQ